MQPLLKHERDVQVCEAVLLTGCQFMRRCAFAIFQGKPSQILRNHIIAECQRPWQTRIKDQKICDGWRADGSTMQPVEAALCGG